METRPGFARHEACAYRFASLRPHDGAHGRIRRRRSTDLSRNLPGSRKPSLVDLRVEPKLGARAEHYKKGIHCRYLASCGTRRLRFGAHESIRARMARTV